MEAPIFISELELTEPIAGITLPARDEGPDYNGARLLVRMQHLPVGYVLVPPDSLDPNGISHQVWLALAKDINMLRSQAGLAALDALPIDGIKTEESLAYKPTNCPLVTVVLCTRERPDSVVATLRGLTVMQYPLFEIVVVDNAPSSNATKEVVLREFGSDSRVRYICEPRPGLSCARNRGIKEAIGDIIAFTDDDVKVDPWWLDGIMRGFLAAPDVACVTGLVATAEIENAAQLYFDLRAGWGNLLERKIFDLTENRDKSPLYPYAAGMFGTGANFAISGKVLNELGGFDEALGAGTPSAGGEDLEIFISVILNGYRLVHEPSAIVSHYHRSDVRELEKQMTGYGSGCTAAITAILLKNSRARREVPFKIASGVMHIFTLRNRVSYNSTLPTGLVVRDVRGMLSGPRLYFKGRHKLPR